MVCGGSDTDVLQQVLILSPVSCLVSVRSNRPATLRPGVHPPAGVLIPLQRHRHGDQQPEGSGRSLPGLLLRTPGGTLLHVSGPNPETWTSTDSGSDGRNGSTDLNFSLDLLKCAKRGGSAGPDRSQLLVKCLMEETGSRPGPVQLVKHDAFMNSQSCHLHSRKPTLQKMERLFCSEQLWIITVHKNCFSVCPQPCSCTVEKNIFYCENTKFTSCNIINTS